MTDLKETFWKRVDGVQAGLLSADGERPVPMSPQADRQNNAIWFITAEGTAAERGAKTGGAASFHIADAKANLYANLDGTLSEVHDEEKLDQLWSAIAAAWFEDGRGDKDVRLIKFTPRQGEVWATEGAAAFLVDIAKANVTQDTADGGDHGTVAF